MFKPLKLLSLLVALCCLCTSVLVLPVSAQGDRVLSVSAESAVLIEAESGAVVFSKNADVRLPMASTTKIMTALVALQCASADQVISVDPAAVGIEGSSVYLVADEKLTLKQLLYALLLESANDAATAIAIGISGSVEAFATQMNQTAAELGLEHTHFTNPHGLYDEEHFTTAYELALLARAALQNELLQTIVSTRKTTIPHPENEGGRLLVNHNKMLRLYDGCTGVKTGFTKQSGRCLVSAAKRNGVHLIAVTLNAPDDWNDHTAMLDHGFARYRSVQLCADDFLYPLPVSGGSDSYVMLGVPSAVVVTLPTEAGEIRQQIECPRFALAPLQSGDVCGKMIFFCDADLDGEREVIAEVPLSAQYAVAQKKDTRSFWQKIIDWWHALFAK